MKVYATSEAWNKMSYWAALGGKENREFTCFGRAHHEDGDMYVTDCYLVKQEGSSAGVDGDDADINRLIMELYEKGIEPDEAFRCWIHSHPGTGPQATYLSGTDDDNIERYLTGQWLISIVLDSKGGNPFCQVDIKEPRMSVKSEVEIYHPQMTEAVKEAAKAEFAEKSSGRSYAVTKWTPGSVGHTDYGGAYHGGGYARGGYVGRGSFKAAADAVRQDGGRYSGPSDLGKVNGVAQSKKSESGGAGTNGTGTQTEMDGMLMLGGAFTGNEDEYDAWLEYLNAEDVLASPTYVITSDTDEIEAIELDNTIDVQPLNADSVPEWVVSMADKIGSTVEDLCNSVNVKEYDDLIDNLVLQVQCGYMQMEGAVEDLQKLGIAKEVAAKELEVRVNA